MCQLTIGALKAARRRGVVIGGWAKLSIDMLKGPEMQPLREYAEKNVIFVDKAPHSWLFTRCSCAVIHGGIGTLVKCWQCGIPPIVCPVGVDQPFNGSVNSVLGCGVHAPLVDECSPDALGYSINVVAGSPWYRSRAAYVKSILQKEDGTLNAAKHIEGILDGLGGK
eukprot:UN0580